MGSATPSRSCTTELTSERSGSPDGNMPERWPTCGLEDTTMLPSPTRELAESRLTGESTELPLTRQEWLPTPPGKRPPTLTEWPRSPETPLWLLGEDLRPRPSRLTTPSTPTNSKE